MNTKYKFSRRGKLNSQDVKKSIYIAIVTALLFTIAMVGVAGVERLTVNLAMATGVSAACAMASSLYLQYQTNSNGNLFGIEQDLKL